MASTSRNSSCTCLGNSSLSQTDSHVCAIVELTHMMKRTKSATRAAKLLLLQYETVKAVYNKYLIASDSCGVQQPYHAEQPVSEFMLNPYSMALT